MLTYLLSRQLRVIVGSYKSVSCNSIVGDYVNRFLKGRTNILQCEGKLAIILQGLVNGLFTSVQFLARILVLWLEEVLGSYQ